MAHADYYAEEDEAELKAAGGDGDDDNAGAPNPLACYTFSAIFAHAMSDPACAPLAGALQALQQQLPELQHVQPALLPNGGLFMEPLAASLLRSNCARATPQIAPKTPPHEAAVLLCGFATSADAARAALEACLAAAGDNVPQQLAVRIAARGAEKSLPASTPAQTAACFSDLQGALMAADQLFQRAAA
jgi:hypothetical protein